MTEENQHLDGNGAISTPNETRESEEALDLESLFQEDSLEDDAPVTREEYNRLMKGVKKIASQVGQVKAQEKTQPKEQPKEEPKSEPAGYSPILKRLYLKESPELDTVWDEVLKETPKGQDPIEYYESKKGWQLEAKARYNAIKEDEINTSKISKPSSQTGSHQMDVAKVKPEEVANLKPSDKIKWLREQAEKERMQGDR